MIASILLLVTLIYIYKVIKIEEEKKEDKKDGTLFMEVKNEK